MYLPPYIKHPAVTSIATTRLLELTTLPYGSISQLFPSTSCILLLPWQKVDASKWKIQRFVTLTSNCILRFFNQHKLFAHGKQLWSSVQEGKPLSLEQMMEFKTLNALHTKGMNDAEKQCQKMKMGCH